MSFDTSTLDTVSADLEAFLKGALPTRWKVLDATAVKGSLTGTALTYELTGVVTEAGQRFPVGMCGAQFSLVLSAPEKDAAKGLRTLLAALPILLAVLDRNSQLSWEDAARGVLDTGETFFRVPITVLTHYDTQE